MFSVPNMSNGQSVSPIPSPGSNITVSTDRITASAIAYYRAKAEGDVETLKSIYYFSSQDDAQQFDRVGPVWAAFRKGLGSGGHADAQTPQMTLIAHPSNMQSGVYWFIISSKKNRMQPWRIPMVIGNNKAYVLYDSLDREYVMYDEKISKTITNADGTKLYAGISTMDLMAMRLRKDINSWNAVAPSKLKQTVDQYKDRIRERIIVYDYIVQHDLPRVIIMGSGAVISGDPAGQRASVFERSKRLNTMSDQAVRDELVSELQNQLRSLP